MPEASLMFLTAFTRIYRNGCEESGVREVAVVPDSVLGDLLRYAIGVSDEDANRVFSVVLQ
jgi:hypothetical protein